MADNPPIPGPIRSGLRSVPQVLVATTAMLSFISYWQAAAVVLNDLASSAYYAAGTAEAFIGKTAPWFVLAIMVFSYGVQAIYIESCSIFVRGGVYRVVKESMGGTMAKLSVSALLFDYILTGPISGVSAGLYVAAVMNELFAYAHVSTRVPMGGTAVIFASCVTAYFWWQNIKGLPESSEKALRIMQLTTVMVVVLLGWCGYTIWVRHSHLPPAPLPHNVVLGKEAMGWLWGTHIPLSIFPLLAIFIGLGHSVLAMTGEETLAQVYREIEHPKLPNLKKAGYIIFIYSFVFTGVVSVLAAMIIPDQVRQKYLGNLIGGLAMNLQGPYVARLVFHVFVVIVGALILSGALNTAIVGSNGVLNRLSEDGVLPEWFRRPHRRFGTSYRIISSIALLQLAVILISGGNFTLLGELYAFGVIWSFTMKGIGVLVLRYKKDVHREYKMPPNITIGGVEIPIGLGAVTLGLFIIAMVNLFTKPTATIAGVSFTGLLFGVFVLAERRTRGVRGAAHIEMDEFNLAQRQELSLEAVGARPNNYLVPVGNYYHLHHLAAVLDRVNPARRDIVVLNIRLLRRSSSGEHELAPDQIFTPIEQYLFTKALEIAEKRGKTIHLAMVAANELYDAMLRAAQSLRSAAIILGDSTKMPMSEQARLLGLAWERLPAPKPQLRLEIYTRAAQTEIIYLGPHAPRLTAKEVDLLHSVWLRLSDAVAPEELHHHDIVHFALDQVRREMDEVGPEGVLARLKKHLDDIRARRAGGGTTPSDGGE
jgi:amino acid transporter